MSGLPNLVGMTSADIEAALAPHVDRAFRGRQVARWVVERNACGFDEMSNLPNDLRLRLAQSFVISDPAVVSEVVSVDGSHKYLFDLADGARVEGVSMRDGGKTTLCLSSQAGCAVGCTFCVTGALGAGRNLRPEEILGQYRVMRRRAGAEVERVNIVFMGMGEPLLNTTHLGVALDILTEKVSAKRITVSTAGVLPGIRWLARRERRPKLAISLNAPDQERRARIMPISRRYPVHELLAELRRFPLEKGRRITFEYVLIDGFNDSAEDARALARLLRGIPSKVNVIPLNEDAEHFPELHRPDESAVDRFAAELHGAGQTATVRWSRGGDVAAACGQLRGRQPANYSVR